MRIASYFLFVLSLVVLAWPATQASAARSEGIAVVVNDGIISRSDVEDRLKLIMISSGLPRNDQTRLQLLPQIVNALIDEKLKMQEAEKYEISVATPEIEKGFEQVAQQNNLTADQFRKAMASAGINPATLRAQIESQIAWSKVVQQRMRSKVTVMDSDVEVWANRFEKSIGKSEYLASEIFLPVDDKKSEMQARQLAQSLVNDLRGGKASFFKVAQQVSQAAGADRGGDLGWVREGQLSEELDQALQNMEPGKVSNPIRSLTGIHILLLREKRTITADNKPETQDIRNMIGMNRLNRLQQRYLMDLKSSAFIDNRIEQDAQSSES